jgi:hypothetical protein
MQGSTALKEDALGQPEQDQGQRSRRSLNEQYPVADRRRAIEAGNNYTQQKKYLDLKGEGDVRLNQSPNKARGKKAIIESLIAGKHGGIGGSFRRISESP